MPGADPQNHLTIHRRDIMRFFHNYRAVLASVLVILVVFCSMLVWYDSKIVLYATSWIGGEDPTGWPSTWLMTIRLDAPTSIWRHFFRVQDASYETQFFKSTNAWRTDPTEDPADLPMPVIIGWNDEHDNYTRLPLRGSTPPLNILLEVHRTHPYDGTDEDKYRVVTVTYTVLGFKRQIILRKPPSSTEHQWVLD